MKEDSTVNDGSKSYRTAWQIARLALFCVILIAISAWIGYSFKFGALAGLALGSALLGMWSATVNLRPQLNESIKTFWSFMGILNTFIVFLYLLSGTFNPVKEIELNTAQYYTLTTNAKDDCGFNPKEGKLSCLVEVKDILSKQIPVSKD